MGRCKPSHYNCFTTGRCFFCSCLLVTLWCWQFFCDVINIKNRSRSYISPTVKIVTDINRLHCLSPLVTHQHRYSRIRREWTLLSPRFQLLPVYSWEYQAGTKKNLKNGLSNGITILVDRKSKCQINFLIEIKASKGNISSSLPQLNAFHWRHFLPFLSGF